MYYYTESGSAGGFFVIFFTGGFFLSTDLCWHYGDHTKTPLMNHVSHLKKPTPKIVHSLWIYWNKPDSIDFSIDWITVLKGSWQLWFI